MQATCSSQICHCSTFLFKVAREGTFFIRIIHLAATCLTVMEHTQSWQITLFLAILQIKPEEIFMFRYTSQLPSFFVHAWDTMSLLLNEINVHIGYINVKRKIRRNFYSSQTWNMSGETFIWFLGHSSPKVASSHIA